MRKDHVMIWRVDNKSLKPLERRVPAVEQDEPMGPREDVGSTGRGGRGVQMVSEPNPGECGVKKASTIGSYGLGAQRRRCDLLVGVNCNTPILEIWRCMRKVLKELI